MDAVTTGLPAWCWMLAGIVCGIAYAIGLGVGAKK